jgi:hypothetical protein
VQQLGSTSDKRKDLSLDLEGRSDAYGGRGWGKDEEAHGMDLSNMVSSTPKGKVRYLFDFPKLLSSITMF